MDETLWTHFPPELKCEVYKYAFDSDGRILRQMVKQMVDVEKVRQIFPISDISSKYSITLSTIEYDTLIQILLKHIEYSIMLQVMDYVQTNGYPCVQTNGYPMQTKDWHVYTYKPKMTLNMLLIHELEQLLGTSKYIWFWMKIPNIRTHKLRHHIIYYGTANDLFNIFCIDNWKTCILEIYSRDFLPTKYDKPRDLIDDEHHFFYTNIFYWNIHISQSIINELNKYPYIETTHYIISDYRIQETIKIIQADIAKCREIISTKVKCFHF